MQRKSLLALAVWIMLASGSLILGFAGTQSAHATQPIDLLVGYADGLRGAGFFPSPWSGDAGVVFVGVPTGSVDEGAIRIDNKSGAPLTIDSVVMTLPSLPGGAGSGGPCGTRGAVGVSFNLWGTNTIPAGDKLILTGTALTPPCATGTGPSGFDTSDFGFIGTCGPAATPGDRSPTITITIGGVPQTYIDTEHVLDTGGFDSVCLGGGGHNESLQWRLIGTCGLDCPGGLVGGELLPIDKNALFIAGAFTNAYWILAALGGIVGAAIASAKVRRRKVEQ